MKIITLKILVIFTIFTSRDSFEFDENLTILEDLTEEQERRGITPLIKSVKDTKGDAYLVCCFNLQMRPHGIERLAKEGYVELIIKASVVGILQGDLRKGEKIEFIIYFGSQKEAKEFMKNFEGGLLFIFRERGDQGRLLLDPQDPCATVPFSETKEKLFNQFFDGPDQEDTN